MQEFKYLGTTLSHHGNMTNASNQMARNFAGAIARVWRICSELGIKNRKQKHAMLWIFPSLCTLCRPIWMSSLGYKYSHIQIFHYNQSPHPPRLLSEDTVGGETKHEYTLPAQGDRSDALVILLVLLCCSLLEQPIEKQRCLAEQDQ